MAGIGLRLREERLTTRQMIELARLAETRGCESIWVAEGSGKDAFAQLTAYALATQRVALGTGIATVYTRTPSLLAMTAATLCPVQGFRLEFTPDRPNLPLYVAALGPKMCQLAGELADGVLLNWATADYVKEAIRT